MHFRAQRKSAQDVSLSDYIDNGSDGAPLELMDVVGDEEDLLETVSRREEIRKVSKAMETSLTDQERQVILLRYGLGQHRAHRQREVAEKIGLSRSYVSRIEKKAIALLKEGMA